MHAVATRDGCDQPGAPSGQAELVDRRIRRRHRLPGDPAQQLLAVAERLEDDARELTRNAAQPAGRIVPGDHAAGDLAQPGDDGVSPRPAQRELHQLHLEQLRPLVQHGALLDDESHHCLLDLGDVDAVRQPEQRHVPPLGHTEARRRCVAEDRDRDPTLLGEAGHDVGEVEPFVEQADRRHRDQGQLATLDGLERRWSCPERGRPFDPALQAHATAEQLGALGQGAAPHVADGDQGTLHQAAPARVGGMLRPAPGIAPAPTR